MPSSTMTPRRARAHEPTAGSERGTTLVLVPALLLVFCCLGAIAVDLSLVHAVHREAHRVASTAADDAAAMIDEREVQVTGVLVVDEERAQRVALAHVHSAELPGEVTDVRVEVGETTVDVALTVRPARVFLPRFSGETSQMEVTARGRLHR